MIKLITNNNLEVVNQINQELSGISTLSTETNTEKPTNEGMNIDVDFGRFAESFKYMGIGMLGIFLITGIIIGVVTILNKIKSK